MSYYSICIVRQLQLIFRTALYPLIILRSEANERIMTCVNMTVQFNATNSPLSIFVPSPSPLYLRRCASHATYHLTLRL